MRRMFLGVAAVAVVAILVLVRTLGASAASQLTHGHASSASSASHAFSGSARAVFKHLLRAHVHPAPRWPAYFTRRGTHGKWSVEGIRGARIDPCCANSLDNGPAAYFVSFYYHLSGGNRGTSGPYANGGFGRTSARSFRRAVRASRHNCAPPRRERLGGREVTYFCYPSTNWWGFVKGGYAYLSMSHVYDFVPMKVISKMISSLRPITHESPPY
jgi:hypothetical protein